MSEADLCDRTAVELAALVRGGELSARELLEAHLERIERVNPALNAIVTLVPERAAGSTLKMSNEPTYGAGRATLKVVKSAKLRSGLLPDSVS